MPDDHSELEPPLPIPNRTVKRYRADDSAETSVKVGYRQANIPEKPLTKPQGLFLCTQFLFLSYPLTTPHSTQHDTPHHFTFTTRFFVPSLARSLI